MVRRTVSWVIRQTYSGFTSKRPVSVTHMAAQAWHTSFKRQPAHSPGRRIFSVAALVSSQARAKPISGTEKIGWVIMPQGVIPEKSRLTIITPLTSGMTAMIHSKQPQEVWGESISEYMLIFSTALFEVL